MSERSSNLAKEKVRKIITDNEGCLVLLGGTKALSVIDKNSHSFFLIEDNEVAELLVKELLDKKVDLFNSLAELEKKYPKQFIKPLFWPDDRPWPPENLK